MEIWRSRSVMPGLVPGISTSDARCPPKRDGRDIGERSDAVLRTAMPGHDKLIQTRSPLRESPESKGPAQWPGLCIFPREDEADQAASSSTTASSSAGF